MRNALRQSCLGVFSPAFPLARTRAVALTQPTLLGWFSHRTDTGPAVLEGTLREDAAAGPFGVSLLLDVSQIERSGSSNELVEVDGGGVRLTVSGALAASHLGEWTAGRRVRVTATLREPAVYLNPGAGDARASLASRGVILVGSIKSAALVVVTHQGSALAEAAASTRAWTRRGLSQFVGRWGSRSAAIATAILIGDRTGLPDEDERRLQEAGTYHVIAISGGNIAILTVFLLVVSGADRRRPAQCCNRRDPYAAVLRSARGADRIRSAGRDGCRRLPAGTADRSEGPHDQHSCGCRHRRRRRHAAVSVVDSGFLLSFGATLGILIIVPVAAIKFTSGPMDDAFGLWQQFSSRPSPRRWR